MRAIAPGKLILSGEHAVVYGAPAIAMAVNRHAQTFLLDGGALPQTVRFDLADLPGSESGSLTLRALRDLRARVRRNYDAFLAGELSIREVLSKPAELFEFAFINSLEALHQHLPHGLDLKLHSNIPIGCGMGSSAATVMSVLRAVGHYFRLEFRPDWYYRFSLEAENLQHGHASGLDTFVSLHGGCVRFEKGLAQSMPLPRVPLYVVQTGTPASTTGEAVAAVKAATGGKGSAAWGEFAAVTDRMAQALRENDPEAFVASVRDNHRLLREIGVVPGKVADFLRETEAAGGAGKICGAGAVAGDAAGMVLVAGARPSDELLAKYGYSLLTVRADPLGARVV
jgi:mevalonate kinase